MQTDHRQHPQRRMVIGKQPPNWAHPVLRKAQKRKTYASSEEAQAELALLHEHYPDLSIPTPGRLYIMIYCSDRPAAQRMVKHVAEIKVNEDGQFYLDIRENIPKRKSSVTPKELNQHQKPQGMHTAKVMLRRNRTAKKPKPDSA